MLEFCDRVVTHAAHQSDLMVDQDACGHVHFVSSCEALGLFAAHELEVLSVLCCEPIRMGPARGRSNHSISSLVHRRYVDHLD
jgi:hypothetical protein